MNNENMNNELNQFGQGMNTNIYQNNMQQPVQPMPTESQGQTMQNVNPMMQGQPVQNVNMSSQPVYNNQIDPNMNVEQNIQPENINPNINPNNMNQTQYGYASNGDNGSLTDENKSNLKFVIILAILMLAFIIMLPYLSNMF